MSQLPSPRALVVLFGGAGRETIVAHLLREGFEIASVIVPARQSPRLARAVQSLAQLGVVVHTVQRSTLAESLAPHAGHQVLSIGFPYLLSPDMLAPFDRPLNVHPTRLPRFRGPTTMAHHFIDGATEAGSTVHIIDAGMDTGLIVAQSLVAIGPFDTLRSIQRKVYESEPALVIDALQRLQQPGFVPESQDESLASTYPAVRTPSDSRIDPDRSLRELYDTIRACDPDDFPAFFEMAGERVCVRLWRPDRPASDAADLL